MQVPRYHWSTLIKKIENLLIELRQLVLARATIQLKFINFIVEHNNLEADFIISKIKDQIIVDLKQETSPTNESTLIDTLSYKLEQI